VQLGGASPTQQRPPISRRHRRERNIAFRYHETGTPFEYELVRYLYTKMRQV